MDIARLEEDLVQIKEELTEYGYIKRHYTGGKKVKITSRPFHYLSSDGFHIYVGKNTTRMKNSTSSLPTAATGGFTRRESPAPT